MYKRLFSCTCFRVPDLVLNRPRQRVMAQCLRIYFMRAFRAVLMSQLRLLSAWKNGYDFSSCDWAGKRLSGPRKIGTESKMCSMCTRKRGVGPIVPVSYASRGYQGNLCTYRTGGLNSMDKLLSAGAEALAAPDQSQATIYPWRSAQAETVDRPSQRAMRASTSTAGSQIH